MVTHLTAISFQLKYCSSGALSCQGNHFLYQHQFLVDLEMLFSICCSLGNITHFDVYTAGEILRGRNRISISPAPSVINHEHWIPNSITPLWAHCVILQCYYMPRNMANPIQYKRYIRMSTCWKNMFLWQARTCDRKVLSERHIWHRHNPCNGPETQ